MKMLDKRSQIVVDLEDYNKKTDEIHRLREKNEKLIKIIRNLMSLGRVYAGRWEVTTRISDPDLEAAREALKGEADE